MTKLSKFSSSEKINCSSVWGGYKDVCWTHTVETGVTTDPCGAKDDQHYMTNDGSSSSSVSTSSK